jgi:hypothetical protein
MIERERVLPERAIAASDSTRTGYWLARKQVVEGSVPSSLFQHSPRFGLKDREKVQSRNVRLVFRAFRIR